MPDSLKDQILTDMKTAMKDRDSVRLDTLKLVSAECKNQEIELQKKLNDVQTVGVLKKQIKHYQESIEQFHKAGRPESAKEQEQRRQILQAYLPQPLTSAALQKAVEEVIAEMGADSIKQMGAVIKQVQSKTAGRADNKSLAKLVRERLQSQ